MKKIYCLCFFLLLLVGCGSSLGSFKAGTIDMKLLYEEVEEQIDVNHWRFAILNSSEWTSSKIEEQYHMDMTKIENSYVKSSLIPSELSEIAIFKVSKKNEGIVREGINYRLDYLKKQWGTYLMDNAKVLTKAKMGRIGKYYYFILGEDSKKVVNYIRNMDE